MDLRKLKTLIDLVSESNVSELEITEAEGKVRIVKSAPATAVAQVMAVAPRCAACWLRRSLSLAKPSAAPGRCARQLAAIPAEPTGHIVKSPMVGHLLSRVQPRRQAVCRGRSVDQGRRDHLHRRGHEDPQRDRVRQELAPSHEILVENGQAVEYGQPLFVIE